MTERSKLSALLTGVMSAVQKAACTAGQQNLHVLKHYFEQDDKSGKLVPLYTRIEVTQGKVMDIPLICLMEPSGYVLDELQMDMSIRLQLAEVKRAVDDLQNATSKKASYTVELCPGEHGLERRSSEVVDVRVKFKASDPAEGLNRIIEDLNNTITPMNEPDAPTRNTLTVRANRDTSHEISATDTEAILSGDTDEIAILADDGEDLEPQPQEPETDHQTGLEDRRDD